ncbi:MAG: ABC transporter ATP-binding protein [Beijerinckiaceae bacterium]|nr:ABC transporter ATP-binding protein [Beijerinckiaceae bacterium]
MTILSPQSDYDTAPDRGGPRQPMLIVQGLRKHFGIGGGFNGKAAVVRAVDGVSFDVPKNKTLGIVGESGCGKSTTAKLLMQLIRADEGEIILDGDPVAMSRGVSLRDYRRSVQMVFQDSYASLNPRLSLQDTVAFGPRATGIPQAAAMRRAHDMLRRVGLAPEVFASRLPHELSGGQRQRVNIARALAMNPRVLILDEAVSALDKSVEAQVLNLLQDLKQELGLTYLFISHDLNVVRYISDRVMVMYLGKVVEIGDVKDVFDHALHPYTRGLLSSRPSMNPRQRRTEPPLSGDPPSPIDPPSGCRFRTRCSFAETVCAEREPPLASLGLDQQVACHAVTPGSGHTQASAGEGASQ